MGERVYALHERWYAARCEQRSWQVHTCCVPKYVRRYKLKGNAKSAANNLILLQDDLNLIHAAITIKKNLKKWGGGGVKNEREEEGNNSTDYIYPFSLTVDSAVRAMGHISQSENRTRRKAPSIVPPLSALHMVSTEWKFHGTIRGAQWASPPPFSKHATGSRESLLIG